MHNFQTVLTTISEAKRLQMFYSTGEVLPGVLA